MPGMSWATGLTFLAFAAAALLIRLRENSWYSPAAFFAAIWFVLCLLPILLGPIPVAPAGVLFVALACVAVFIGGEVARRRVKVSDSLNARRDRLPLLESLIVGSTLLGIASVLIVLGSRGRGPQVFLSLSTLADVARDFSVARYSGGWQEPASARVLVTFIYFGALLGGILLANQRSGWTRWLALAPFVPSAMTAAVLTTKASLALPIALAASSYLSTHLVANSSLPRLDVKRVVLLAAVSLFLVGLFVLVQMGRYSYTTLAQAGSVLNIFRLDLFPYMGVFADWLQRGGWATRKPAWGLYTFGGLFDLLHLGNRAAGIYTDQVTVGGAPYNIYTAFRGLIQDFTLPGALAVLALLGYGARFAFSKVRRGDLRYAAPLAAFYVFTLWSFIVDVFAYNTILAAFALLTAYLLLAPLQGVNNAAAILDRPWLRGRSSHLAS